MSYWIGISLAVAIGLLGTVGGCDRDRGFYPTLLMVIASYYVLFAAIGGSANEIGAEVGTMVVFVAVAISSLRRNLWIVVIGLAAHGVFDAFHAALAADTSAPAWWPAFCLAFDVTAAVYVAFLIKVGRIESRAPLAARA